MKRTITVKKETARELQMVKHLLGLKNVDQVIMKLIDETRTKEAEI